MCVPKKLLIKTFIILKCLQARRRRIKKHSDHYNNTMKVLSETHLYYGGGMEGRGGNPRCVYSYCTVTFHEKGQLFGHPSSRKETQIPPDHLVSSNRFTSLVKN